MEGGSSPAYNPMLDDVFSSPTQHQASKQRQEDVTQPWYPANRYEDDEESPRTPIPRKRSISQDQVESPVTIPRDRPPSSTSNHDVAFQVLSPDKKVMLTEKTFLEFLDRRAVRRKLEKILYRNGMPSSRDQLSLPTTTPADQRDPHTSDSERENMAEQVCVMGTQADNPLVQKYRKIVREMTDLWKIDLPWHLINQETKNRMANILYWNFGFPRKLALEKIKTKWGNYGNCC